MPVNNISRSNRDERIDFMRGICVLGMVMWHLLTDDCFPKWLSMPLIQSVNFVAEGFVFLAGVSVSIVTHRKKIGATTFIKRGLELLLVHYAIVTVLLLLSHLNLISLEKPNGNTITAVLSLQYQPYLGDVLTVFFFLFCISPLLLKVQTTYGSRFLFALSLITFLAWQPQALYPKLQVNAHGAFDVNTWQLVFVLGLLCGHRTTQLPLSRDFNYFKATAWILISFLLIAAIRLLCISGKLTYLPPDTFGRHPLTAARLIYISLHFLLFSTIIYGLWSHLKSTLMAREIILFGQNSLLLFSISVPLDYIAKQMISSSEHKIIFGVISSILVLGVLLSIAHAKKLTHNSLPEP